MPIFNTLSYKIFYSVAEEYIAKYDVDNIEREDGTDADTAESAQTAPLPDVPQAAAHEAAPTIFDSDIKTKPNNNTRNIIIAVVALIVAGAAAWFVFSGSDSKNNPLGVQKPKWEKFAMVKVGGVKLYKEADTSSPNLQIAIEQLDGCMPGEKLLWQGDKAPRGYDVSDYDVESSRVFPVLDESDSWYRIYIGTGEVREAYLQKECCEEVKPEPITKDIIDKVKTGEQATHRLVDKGEFANLYLERYFDEMGWGETITAGVLSEGCIIMPYGCFFNPIKTDTTGVGMRNISDSPDYNSWQLVCPGRYWKDSADDSDGMFDVNLLDDSDLRKVVMAVRPASDTGSNVLYYFPTVATDRFIEFEYSFSPAAEMEMEAEEQQPTVTKYKVEGEKLKAWLGDEEQTVKLDFGNINLIEVKDLDGDGNMEAVICHFMAAANGEPMDCPIEIYYDAETGDFKHTDEMKLTATPAFEENGDGITIIQREGLKAVRYKFAEGKLTITDDSFKNIGHVIGEIDMNDLFDFGDSGEKTVGADFFGNSPDDVAKLTFVYEFGGYYHGLKMELNGVELLDGSTKSAYVAASKFQFLEEKTNGMPDIIGDNYLYRWNGNGYEQYGWDGKNFVKCNV